MQWPGRKLDLPPAVWLLPLGTAIASVVIWTVWCDSPTAAWVGAVLVVVTGLLVISLVLEGLPHRPGWGNRLGRLGVAVATGVVAALVTFGAALLGLYLRCPFFNPRKVRSAYASHFPRLNLRLDARDH